MHFLIIGGTPQPLSVPLDPIANGSGTHPCWDDNGLTHSCPDAKRMAQHRGDRRKDLSETNLHNMLTFYKPSIESILN